MARVTVDFSEVQDFAPIEDGVYAAEITDCEYREPQTEDKYPYLNVEFTIREEGEFQGSKTWGIWSLSPKALWRMKEDWESLGILSEGDEIDIDYDEETMKVTDPEIIGMPCLLKVVQESYEGKARSRADSIIPDENQPPAPEEKKTAAKKAPAAKKETAKAGTSRRKFQ